MSPALCFSGITTLIRSPIIPNKIYIVRSPARDGRVHRGAAVSFKALFPLCTLLGLQRLLLHYSALDL